MSKIVGALCALFLCLGVASATTTKFSMPEEGMLLPPNPKTPNRFVCYKKFHILKFVALASKGNAQLTAMTAQGMMRHGLCTVVSADLTITKIFEKVDTGMYDRGSGGDIEFYPISAADPEGKEYYLIYGRVVPDAA